MSFYGGRSWFFIIKSIVATLKKDPHGTEQNETPGKEENFMQDIQISVLVSCPSSHYPGWLMEPSSTTDEHMANPS